MADYILNENNDYVNVKTGHIKKWVLDKNNDYYKTDLYIDGKAVKVYKHRVIAEKYIPNPNNLPQINHIDGDKTNNSIENLEWCTAKENMNHRNNTGLSERLNKYQRMMVERKEEVLAVYKETKSKRETAKIIGIDRATLNKWLEFYRGEAG